MPIERLLVRRAAIAECRLDAAPVPVLAAGDVLARVNSVALTANNVTYAVMGEAIGYWQFFPEDADWGVVPAWGHAEIVESACEDVPTGTRFWGFLPMASHVVMQPVRVSPRGFIDGAAHRAALPPVYNHYALTRDDPPALAAMADARSLFFPLFTTSYLIADYLADNGLFGAAQVIIGSASSKTGFGTAHFAAALDPRPAVITGLTSPGNRGFVESLGLYDRVIGYGDVAALDPAMPSVYIDMAGDGAVLSAVHHHFGDALTASITVGATHWQAPRDRGPIPGPAPSFFFAPAHIQKRDAEWGAGELMRRATIANIGLVEALGDRMRIEHRVGGAAVADAWGAAVAGTLPPSTGVILSFGGGDAA